MKHIDIFFSEIPASFTNSNAACAVPPVANKSSWMSTTSSFDSIPSYITKLSPSLYSKSYVIVCTFPGSLFGLRIITKPHPKASAKIDPKTNPLASIPTTLVGFRFRFYISETKRSFSSCKALLSAKTGPKSLKRIPGIGKSGTLRIFDSK